MSITAPAGFRAAGVAAGIKANGALDLALVVNDGPDQHAAGVFTTNKVQAAPVLWSRQVLTHRRLRAVVLNSGGANACTGPEGFQTTHATAERVGEVLGCGAVEVAVCSTGLIGAQLPRDLVLAGVDTAAKALGATERSATDAATAVLTTDNHPKQAVYQGAGWRIGGFAKGSGMIAPAMATMLVVLSTDAVVEPGELDRALRTATGQTFDRLDIDGGTSTNDTVLLLASGASGVPVGGSELSEAVTAICTDLVDQLQADAEGVTKHVTIAVHGARTEADALAVGRTVARDNLCKTAFFASDPNWGRIAMAVGNAGADLDPDKLEIRMNGVTVCRDGQAQGDRLAADLSGRDILVEIGLGVGEAGGAIRTTDLSHAYVEENSAYSS